MKYDTKASIPSTGAVPRYTTHFRGPGGDFLARHTIELPVNPAGAVGLSTLSVVVQGNYRTENFPADLMLLARQIKANIEEGPGSYLRPREAA